MNLIFVFFFDLRTLQFMHPNMSSLTTMNLLFNCWVSCCSWDEEPCRQFQPRVWDRRGFYKARQKQTDRQTWLHLQCQEAPWNQNWLAVHCDHFFSLRSRPPGLRVIKIMNQNIFFRIHFLRWTLAERAPLRRGMENLLRALNRTITRASGSCPISPNYS